jgi:hypothetical protein
MRNRQPVGRGLEKKDRFQASLVLEISANSRWPRGIVEKQGKELSNSVKNSESSVSIAESD